MPTRSTTYPLVDAAFGGHLAAKLAEWRAEGMSSEAIAFRLRTDHNVTVSTTTVHRWLTSGAPSEVSE